MSSPTFGTVAALEGSCIQEAARSVREFAKSFGGSFRVGDWPGRNFVETSLPLENAFPEFLPRFCNSTPPSGFFLYPLPSMDYLTMSFDLHPH
jgi:hypothetical protein